MIAEGSAELLELRWQGLREIRKYAPEWKAHIDRLYRERSLATHLRETPLLKNLSDEDLQKVAAHTLFESYGDFEWNTSYRKVREASAQERLAKEPVIAHEGDYPNGLILIRSGFARLSRKYNHGERTISYLGKGDVFGLAALLGGKGEAGPLGLQFSLRAIGYVDILLIPTPIFEEFIAPRFGPGGNPRHTGEVVARAAEIDLGPGCGSDFRTGDDRVPRRGTLRQRHGHDVDRSRSLHALRRLRAGLRRKPRQQSQISSATAGCRTASWWPTPACIVSTRSA